MSKKCSAKACSEEQSAEIDKIVFGNQKPKYLYGLARFKDLDICSFEKLVKKKYIDLSQSHNFSGITANDFYRFMKKHPGFKLHGFSYRHNDKWRTLQTSTALKVREMLQWDNCGICIEGIEINLPERKKVGENCIFDFVKLCRFADDLILNEKKMYAWWD